MKIWLLWYKRSRGGVWKSAVFSSLSLFFKLTGSVTFITLFLIDPRNAEIVLQRKHSLKNAGFSLPFEEGQLQPLIIPIQCAATNSTDGEDGKGFCESHVDTAVAHQTLLTGWWM